MPDEQAAREELERAIAGYQAVRFGRGSRAAEWGAARRLDAARAAFAQAGGTTMPAGAERRPGRLPDLGRTFASLPLPRIPGPLALLLEVVPALALILGITLPVAYFFAARPEATPAVDRGVAVSRAGGVGQPPRLAFQPPPGSRVSRLVDIRFSSDLYLDGVDVRLRPDPGVPCEATLDSGVSGRIRCASPLPGGLDLTAEIRATGRYSGAQVRTDYSFRTADKLDRLLGVKWFTEFEDPSSEPLACAAASVRILATYTTGVEQMSAEAILRTARPFNRSADPGLDPVAIATAIERLDPKSAYHYYVHPSREAATKAAVWWFTQSAKPVVIITLGGQHAPVMIGFTGTFFDRYDDPRNDISGLVMLDPQRGDIDPRTARFRPDKSRSIDFQTGREVTMLEWLRDEWWFGSPYTSAIPLPNGSALDVERNDGAYPRPHWAGGYVIIVDDGDADHPPSLMGRRAPDGR